MRKTLSTLIALVAVLVAFGIVVLASSSSVKGSVELSDPLFFLKRQVIWLLISLVLFAVVVRVDYHHWQRLAAPMCVAALLLMIVVFIPPIGRSVKGSWRWIHVGPLTFQPSEFAKFAVVVALSAWMASIGPRAKRFREGFLMPIGGIGIACLLLLMEPDFGTTSLVGAVGFMILFAAGTRILYLLVAGIAGVCGLGVLIARDPVRLGRVLAFVMPDKYPATAYHLNQSKISFMAGGLKGVGLMDSMQKQLYLPEPHTDFILAIVAEELGYFATMSVLLLFVGVLLCGLWISVKARDVFGRLLAFGVTMMLAVQSAINIGVVTGCLPTKGLALPFISYGGSSLMMSLIFVGVLANVAVHGTEGHEDPHTRMIKDRHHVI